MAGPTEAAGINASVLSLLIGAVFAYGMYVHGKMEDLRLEAMEAAREINELRMYGYYGIGAGWTNYLSSHPTNREATLREAIQLGMHGSMEPDPAIRSENAASIVRNICKLAAAYPFPQSASPGADGGAEVHMSEPKPVDLGSIQNVTDWASEMERMSRLLLWLDRAHMGSKEKLLDQFSSDWEKTHLENAPEELRDQIASANPVGFVSGFMENVGASHRIARAVKARLTKLEAYEGSTPSRSMVLAVIATAGLVFLAGVVVPLVAPSVHQVVYLWIPCLYYFLALLVILSTVQRFYRV